MLSKDTTGAGKTFSPQELDILEASKQMKVTYGARRMNTRDMNTRDRFHRERMRTIPKRLIPIQKR